MTVSGSLQSKSSELGRIPSLILRSEDESYICLWKQALIAQFNCFSSVDMRFWLIVASNTEECWTWLRIKEFKKIFLHTMGIMFLKAYMHFMPWAIFDKRITCFFWYLRSLSLQTPRYLTSAFELINWSPTFIMSLRLEDKSYKNHKLCFIRIELEVM